MLMSDTLSKPVYCGRFAPSPTGPLHFGSLLAALASFLDARAHQGRWLLRIEDLDPPREDPQASSHFQRTLEQFGLHWDGDIRFQSQRAEAYQQALEHLIDTGHAFPCSCSRKQLGGKPHQGRCTPNPEQSQAWRFLSDHQPHAFHDRLQGQYRPTTAQELDDFIIRRRDTLWSYQLAVVIDDRDQGITHVVRGIDLIDSTPRQIQLQRAFGYPAPEYAHIPVAVERNGQKLSKQNLALALDGTQRAKTLWIALDWLQQSPPSELQNASVDELLEWAIAHWSMAPLAHLTQSPAPERYQRSSSGSSLQSSSDSPLQSSSGSSLQSPSSPPSSPPPQSPSQSE